MCMFRLEIERGSQSYSNTKCIDDLWTKVAASKSGRMEKESLEVTERNLYKLNIYESRSNNKQLFIYLGHTL